MTLGIALATCATLPDLDPDDSPLIGLLEDLGAQARAAVWDDPHVDWSNFDLVVIRSTWDYTSRRDAFLAWAESVPSLANPAETVAWNTDKRYLIDVEAAGLPVVPTSWLEGDLGELPRSGMHVLKPAVGAGSVDAERFNFGDPREAVRARDHARRLFAAGHTVMVQPYVASVEQRGETGLVYLGGVFSHAISKATMLAANKRLEAGGLYRQEKIARREPAPAELDLADRALAIIPGGPNRLTYARVDMVAGPRGRPMIMELELTEPSLFMHTAPGAAERFAEVIVSHTG